MTRKVWIRSAWLTAEVQDEGPDDFSAHRDQHWFQDRLRAVNNTHRLSNNTSSSFNPDKLPP